MADRFSEGNARLRQISVGFKDFNELNFCMGSWDSSCKNKGRRGPTVGSDGKRSVKLER